MEGLFFAVIEERDALKAELEQIRIDLRGAHDLILSGKSELAEVRKRLHECHACGAPLGDPWCADCAGRADRERAEAAEAERDALRTEIDSIRDALHLAIECHCTVDALNYNIARAEAAEAERDMLKAELGSRSASTSAAPRLDPVRQVRTRRGTQGGRSQGEGDHEHP